MNKPLLLSLIKVEIFAATLEYAVILRNEESANDETDSSFLGMTEVKKT